VLVGCRDATVNGCRLDRLELCKTCGVWLTIVDVDVTVAESLECRRAVSDDIDIYDGQPDTAGLAQLQAIKSATVYGGVSATYEHVDLRVDKAQGDSTAYTGPFAGNSQKAQDLRHAFLLALPREAILAAEVTPFNPKGVVMNSQFTLPGQTGYDTIIKSSGNAEYTAGTQAERTAAALALVKKYYPSASASNQVVSINFLFKGSQRRIDENKLIAAEEAKAGFTVSTTPNSKWSTLLSDVSYDAAMFAWAPSSVSQTGTNANFQTDGGNNHSGWGSAALDTILHSLESYLTPSQITAKYLAAEKSFTTTTTPCLCTSGQQLLPQALP